MNRKIDFAILDSGTGGIPYMIDIKNKRPDCRCIYLGDTAHFPYGQKTREEIIECACQSAKKMIETWQPKSLVIACNTISVTALDELRRRFDIPIIGTVPAVKLASKVSHNKRIGLLATNGTVNHEYTKKLIQDYASECTVISRGDPDLVAFIEHSYFKASMEEKLQAVKPSIDFFKENNCDTVILGCTHFTHIATEYAQAAGKDMLVIDSRDGVSNQAIKVRFGQGEALSDNTENITLPEDMSFFVSCLRDKEDEAEYKQLCKAFNIPWGGVLQV